MRRKRCRPTARALIELRKITKIYQIGKVSVRALDGVDLEIEEGEFVAIMGPSGSGKSTLMNIIGCLDVPTSGTYVFEGTEVSKLTDNELAEIRNKRIGFVFQNFNLLPRATALENVELPLIYSNSTRKLARAREALQQVGLLEWANHRPSELSGGQCQKVAIARALVNDPAVILADEPTGNLDTRSGTEIMKILQALNDQGRTIILVTHDSYIAEHAKRIVRLLDGRIVSHEVVQKRLLAAHSLRA